MKKIIVTKSQLNEIYNTPQLKKIQRNIYKSVSDYCGKMHSDSAWQDVKTLIGMIKSVNGVTDVHVGAGQYTNYTNPENGAYRDYETIVETEYGNLYGYIRCHAAGTMDDIFKYYDMTISLYPDKKRDMNEGKNLNEVMDNQKSQIVFTGNNPTEMGKNAQEKYNDAIRGGFRPNAITMQGKSEKNNATDKDEVVVGFDTSKQNINRAVADATQTAINNGADFNKITLNGNPEDITNGVAEGKVYTKKNVEIARLYEMRRNGKVMTKSQLIESLLGNDDLEETLKSKNVFEILQAFGETFGDDALQQLSTTWDMLGKIMEIYNSAPSQKQEEFKQKINGEDENNDENVIDLELDIPDVSDFK